MNSILEYFKQSEFALAAYANLIPGVDPIPALQDNNVGMSSSQAAAFVEKWQVVAQSPYSATGLSATVFQSKEDGAKYLVIRGTEASANDVVSSTILALGWPSEFNPQFLALKSQIENVWMKDPNVPQGQNFVVTGHSLGGYLAATVKSTFL